VKIYTKVGDGGDTRLYGGKKVRKTDARVRAYGEVDELNSALGWISALLKERKDFGEIVSGLTAIQGELFDMGADLATPPDARTPKSVPRLTAQAAARLEAEIDDMQSKLPPLQTFILPGGSPAGAACHLARTVCRRAERAVVELSDAAPINPVNQIYLNRLSDYLFVAARFVNHLDDLPETPWAPK
jgi:cob(I)alamin adenosyltransferase